MRYRSVWDGTAFLFREEQDMPYIEVDEVPEGTEAVDVVLRSEYDAVVQERDSTAAQRDEALQQIEEAHAEVRKVKERYADAILTAGRATNVGNPKSEQTLEPKLKMSTSALFN